MINRIIEFSMKNPTVAVLAVVQNAGPQWIKYRLFFTLL